MPHYPEQRFMSRYTVIRRVVYLPDDAVGLVEVLEDKRVDVNDVVVRGIRPGKHVIVDALAFFGFSKASQLDDLWLVDIGEMVEDITPLAGKNPERGKRLFSPVKGRVKGFNNGRVIIEELPEVIDLRAGVRGRVAHVYEDRGVTIESTGALLQGIWGNGKRSIATLKLEPDEGIENFFEDQLNVQYSGSIVIINRTLTPTIIDLIEKRGLAGIIAPGMDYDLIDLAMNAPRPILITEGFGDASLSRTALNIVSDFVGQQVTLDAYTPVGFDNRRPELIVNIRNNPDDNLPSRPNIMLSLRKDMNVRITREPYIGETGQIVNLPKSPILLDNGLRVLCAEVELIDGTKLFVPLTNLEIIGR